MVQRGARGAAAPVEEQAEPPAASDRIFLAAILAIGAGLRVWLPFLHVFGGPYVNFQTHDSWFHIRLVDNLVRNFPHPLHTDPYAAAGGMPVPSGPLFDFLIVSAAGLVSFGTPSTATVETVAAFAPVVLALVTVAATYAIGRRMFDSLTGLLAAALLATLPGPFLDRTVLGYVDHHAAEACFSALTLLWLTRALQRHRAGGARATRETVVASVAAGVALGAYLITWTSGAFLVFILAAWAAAQYTLDHARRAASDRVLVALGPAIGTAAIVLMLFEDSRVPQHDIRLAALAGTAGTLVMLEGLRRFWARLKWPPFLFVAGVLATGVVAATAFALVAPGTFRGVLANVGRMAPGSTAQTVGEARPLFGVDAVTSALRAWFEFRATFFLAAPAILLLLADVWRRRVEERGLLVVWTIVAMLATIGQSRFGYYLSIELALMAGWLSARLLRWAGATSEAPRARLLADAVVVIVAAVVFYPSIPAALRTAQWDLGPPRHWHAALEWMRTSTPEPFADPNQYFAPDASPPVQPAYTVMNWWDHGYWLMRIARRVPVANPTQNGAVEAARFFMETDEREAARLLGEARARYIVTGEELPPRNVASATPWQRWFEAMPVWTNRDPSLFYQVFFERRSSGSLVPVRLFNAAYYMTMTSRLYMFGGEAVPAVNSTWVVTYENRTGTDGGRFLEITSSRLFDSYDAATRHVAAIGPGKHLIAGRDPRRSCIPLPALDLVKRVYDSPEVSAAFAGIPAVRIFEVVNP